MWEFFNNSACNFCDQRITFDTIGGSNSTTSIACDKAMTNHTSVQNLLPGYGTWILQVCNVSSSCNSNTISFCVLGAPTTPTLVSPKNMGTITQQPIFTCTESNFGKYLNIFKKKIDVFIKDRLVMVKPVSHSYK